MISLSALIFSAVLPLHEVRPLARLDVSAQNGFAAQSIDIFLDGSEAPRTRDEWSSRTWTAVRSSGGIVQTISSADCPALKTQAELFRSLPPIAPAPLAAIVGDEALPLSPITLGGWGAMISFETFSGARVQVSGTDAWAAWGSQTINDLSSCWAIAK